MPAVTCRAEFVPYFLNLLRDWTAAVWSSRNVATATPLKAQTPVQGGNHLTLHSFRSADVTPVYTSDRRNRSFTPDSNQRLDSWHSSTQRPSSAKSRPHGLSDVSPSVPSCQEVNRNELRLHSSKPDFACRRPLRQHNTALHIEHSTPSAKERHGRALFSDASASCGCYNIRNSVGKHKSSVGNKIEKAEKTPVPSFNLDSNVDFPDMKSSQR